jgi:hypothetical protein
MLINSVLLGKEMICTAYSPTGCFKQPGWEREVNVPHVLFAQNSSAHTSVPAAQAPAVHVSSPLQAFPSEHWAAVVQAAASTTQSGQA